MSDAGLSWAAPFWRSVPYSGGQYLASVWVFNGGTKATGVTVKFFDQYGKLRGQGGLGLQARQTGRVQAPMSPEGEQATMFWGWVQVQSDSDVPVVPWGETVPSSINVTPPYFV